MKRLAVIWVTVLFFLLFILGRCWTQTAAQERWYQLRIGGHAVGYVLEQVQPEAGAGPIQTTQVMSMKLNRLGRSVALNSRAVCRESADGHLRELISEVHFSEQPVTTYIRVFGQEIWVSSSAMPASAASAERRIAFSGKLSGLEGIRRLTQDALDRPGDSVMYQTFAPDLGIMVKGMRRFMAWEEKTILGKSQKWKKVLETLQGMPVNRQLWFDEHGRPVASAEPFPFGEMTMELTERVEVLPAAQPWKRKEVKLYKYRSADVSGALQATGNDVFILEATGSEASRTLEQLLSTLTL